MNLTTTSRWLARAVARNARMAAQRMVLKVKPAVMPVNVDKVALLHKVVASVSVLWVQSKMALRVAFAPSVFILATSKTQQRAPDAPLARAL